jgi:predicted nucleic acid-binding protein
MLLKGDASAIIAPSIIGQLKIPEQLFNEIVIPTAVMYKL